MSSASVTWPGKQASLFHAYLSSIAYASLAPTEMSLFGENEIRNLGEAVTRRKIGADNFDVALSLFEDVADVSLVRVFHR